MVPKWMGPYRITNLKDNKLAQLRNLKTQFVMANLISVDRLKLYKEASAPPNKKACCEDEESPENQIDNIPIEEVDVQSQEDMDQEELSTELLPRVLNCGNLVPSKKRRVKKVRYL